MISPDRYDYLARTVELFHGIDKADIAKIFVKGKTMRVNQGQVLFHEGTTGSQMFVILGGKISLYRNKKHLCDLRTGDMLGEMALVSQAPRTAQAVAAEDSLVFVLDETTFDKLMTKRVAVRMLMNIIRTLCRRLTEADQRLTTG